ncbi:alanine racemase C-terminal domain-containing protein [Salinarimonas sp. NSM]|uniref:alanine racemase C-terminal domain-containing protein n=1 Tax=Salinarimonas sp. NSM TaxID=3458003 RepID=UPI004036DB76
MLAFLLALADTPGLAVECPSCGVVPRPELDGASQARALAAEVGLFLEIVRAYCRHCEARGLARPETSVLSTASSQLPMLATLLDGTGLVCVDRIGNDFYGSHSSAQFRADGAEQVMHAAFEISDVIHRPRGATVGYERLYRVDASGGEPIAVAGVGWSSYGRTWQGRGKAAQPGFVVDASGEAFSFVGRQSMNITTLAARSETGSTLHPGDLVFLLADERVVAGSGDWPTVAEVAARMGGVQHEHVTAMIGLSRSAVRFEF